MSQSNWDEVEPRPVCGECGKVVHPETAVPIHTLTGEEQWIVAPTRLKGLYCCSDHALNAYLRGYGYYLAASPQY